MEDVSTHLDIRTYSILCWVQADTASAACPARSGMSLPLAFDLKKSRAKDKATLGQTPVVVVVVVVVLDASFTYVFIHTRKILLKTV